MTYYHPDFLKNTPYFDDFDDTKRFLKILFKPGYSVQARELTQLQTLLQTQISRFGDHIFRDGSLVFGGLTSLNKVRYVRVTPNYQISNFKAVENQTLLNLRASGPTVRAKVLHALPVEGDDNTAILFLQYLTGTEFSLGEEIYVNDNATKLVDFWGGNPTQKVTVLPTTSAIIPTIGDALLASVDHGIFYVDGYFVRSENQTIPLYKLNENSLRVFTTPNNRVGFNINRDIVTPIKDSTLKDPANGSYNFNAPGADRYKIDLSLVTKQYIGDNSIINAGDLSDKDFIELARVVNGKLTFIKKIPTYSDILEIFARRTYDESGNYTVKPFTLNLKENLRRDKIRFTIRLTPGSATARSTSSVSFNIPSIPQTPIPYEIGASESDRILPMIGDTLTSTDTGVVYDIVNAYSIDIVNGTAIVEVIPQDAYVTDSSNPYEPVPGKLIIADERFLLKRRGSVSSIVNNHYTNISPTVSIISDTTGFSSLLEGGTSSNFSAEISDGKAYIFGYEYETVNPITITAEKPRTTNTVLNEIVDTTLGNYLNILTTNNFFNNIDKIYDTTFDINNLPDVYLQKQFITLLLPNSSTNYSKFKVKYFSKSERNSFNNFQNTGYTFDNWENNSSRAPALAKYPDVVFIQSLIEGGNVLREEVGSDTPDTTDDDNGLLTRRIIGGAEDKRIFNRLLGVQRDTGGSYIPQTYPTNPPEILDTSYETETNISRLVFTEQWHGDFKTAYDSSLDSSEYLPSTDKLTRTYIDDSSNHVYQLDYINLADVPVDEVGNVSLSDLTTRIRVKRGYTRAWVPGSTRETGSITGSSLFIKIPSSNVVFGPDVGIQKGFCLPDTNSSIQESGVVFNPTDGKEISYGSSIVSSSQETNVVEITLLTPPGVTRCEQTIGDITVRGFGSYTEGSTVVQTYIKYVGTSETDKFGTTVTVQGTIIKVIPSGSTHKVFVKISGSSGDFIPQNYETLKIPGTQVNMYEGISALLMSDNIFTSPICSCHTIKTVDLLDDRTGTCGIFTSIIFSDGSGFGDFIVGERVYQYDIDYVPLNNSAAPTNFDGTKILAQGTVVDWDGTKLTLIATKNEFKAKSGWVFGKTSKVKYGGRGWSTNYHKTSQITSGSSTVFEIEKVKGAFVYIKSGSLAFYNDEFNSTDPNIPKIAYQVKTYIEENILPEPPPGGSVDAYWTESSISLEKPEIIQTYLVDGEPVNAKGQLIYFRQGDPTSGPTIMTIQANPVLRDDFKFKLRTTSPLTITSTISTKRLSFNLLNAQKIKPQISIYSTLETEIPIPGEIVSTTTVAKAKAKQIKYIPKAGIDTNKDQYSLYLTDITPYSVEGAIFKVDNLYSVMTTIGASDIKLFDIGDTASSDSNTFNIQEPKNNTLLYKYPVGNRIKQVTDLTYELQLDLSATLNETTKTLSFTTEILGTTEFKGSYLSGTVRTIDKSILNEYILISSKSKVFDLTDATKISSIVVDEGTQKTLTITFSSVGGDVSVGDYRLLCPVVVKGSLSSNIRKKTKKRNIEVTRFDPVTGTMMLKKSDVISVDSCLNLSNNTELPKQAFKLNNNQTLNLYKLSTITGNEKWRDLGIRNASGQVTSEPNGIWCLVSYTYFDHGTQFGPIIPSSYVDGYDNIPSFVDPLTNEKISLDSVIDFRPFERINSSGIVVSSGTYGVPISGSRMNVSYQYYLPQNYKIILSRDQKFHILEGEASTEPEYPNDTPNSMSLFKLEMPPYLTSINDSKSVSLNHQRYTMNDIRNIEDRLDNLEYVTRLSYLEQAAKDISIKDDGVSVLVGSGADATTVDIYTERPKTSILVDSFINHEIADTNNPDYNACIDSSNNTLRPPFEFNQFDLEINPSRSIGNYILTKNNQSIINLGYSLPPNILTLNYTSEPLIKQILATNFAEINPFSNTVWFGTMSASNYTDSYMDTNTKPYVLSNYSGENDSFLNMDFSPNNNNLGAFGTKWNFWQTNWQGYTENNKQIKTLLGRVQDQINALTPKTPRKKINKKSINIDVVPYMNPKSIKIYVRGLKPLTVVYPYFGGVRVDAYIRSELGTVIGSGGIQTDINGNLTLIFDIPKGNFQSGNRLFYIMDDENNQKQLCTTYAEFKYTNSSSKDISDYENTFGSTVTISESNIINDYRTVLAQTFFVDPIQYPRGVYVNSIDVYFKSKDTSLPITLELTSVSNGVPNIGPGTQSYPNSTVMLKALSVNQIENGSLTSQNGTPFIFNAPVHLLPGEHAFVLKTNSSNYSVYTSEVGEIVYNTENRASVQPFVGKMMKTNNSQNWTVFENTDISFTLNRCVFEQSATVVFSDIPQQKQETQYSLVNINLSYIDFNTNSLDTTIKTIDTTSVTDSAFDKEDIILMPNVNYEFNKLNYYKHNGKSFALYVNLVSDGVIAPMVDLDTLKVYTVTNIIKTLNGSRFSKGSTTVTKEENETYPLSIVHEDFLNSRYITKTVTLDPDMQTRDCFVYFKLNKPKGTDIKVYIKRQFKDSDISINETEYEEMTPKINLPYSTDPNKYTEVYYKIPDTRLGNEFIRYSIKIIMFSDIDNSPIVPKIKDLKIITVS